MPNTTPVDRLFHDVTVIVNGRRVLAVEFLGNVYLPDGQRLANVQHVVS